MRMRFCPRARLLFAVEKPVDDDGLALGRLPPTRAGSFATDHIRSSVYGDTRRIGKDNFTAIRNSLWINRAMPFA